MVSLCWGVCKASRWRHRTTVPAHRHACARNIVTLQLQDGGYWLLRKRFVHLQLDSRSLNLFFFSLLYLYIRLAPLLPVVLHAVLQFIYICSRVISSVHCLLVTLLHIVKVHRFNKPAKDLMFVVQVLFARWGRSYMLYHSFGCVWCYYSRTGDGPLIDIRCRNYTSHLLSGENFANMP